MAHDLVDNLFLLESGIIVYDALMKQKIIAMCPILCILCDNVRAAELVNHLGNLLCMVSIMHHVLQFVTNYAYNSLMSLLTSTRL